MAKNIKLNINTVGFYAVSLLVSVLSLAAIYLYGSKAVEQKKAQHRVLSGRIKDVEAAVSRGNTVEQGILDLRENFLRLDGKFSSTEQENLAAFSSLAREYNIEAVSIVPQSGDKISAAEVKTAIGSRRLNYIPVALELRGAYKDIAGYLEALKDRLPAFVTVEDLKISRQKPGSSFLAVYAGLNIYLLSP